MDADRRRLAQGLAGLAAGAVLPPLWAQGTTGVTGWPTRPVRVIIPFAPGGGTDIVARVVAGKLQEAWGQPFVADNKAGGNGTIGLDACAKAAPDGHTLSMVTGSASVNVTLQGGRQPYDLLKDLAPVTQITSQPYALVVNPKLPVRQLSDLIALAKARPGTLNYGSSGPGGLSHLSGELFCSLAQIRMTHVPYKGGSQALADVVSGQIDMLFSTRLQAHPFIVSNRVKALAVTTSTRSATAPEIPTMAEAGVPGYEVAGWYGLMAPAATSPAIVDKLQQEIVRILQDTLQAVDATRDCAVWGTSRRLSAPHAALVNGTQVQGFELDDVHRAGVLHVGAVVQPALLALAERHRRLDGRSFLAAAVAGYEVGPRVGLCMGPEHIGQGWHSGATLGVFSAAAGAARGLSLDVDRTVHALGIAGTQASGLMAAQYGAMVKRMHAGRASQSGLYGALLAEQGFTGILDVLESPYGGYCTTFSRSSDRFRLEELTAGLGSVWQTMAVALKFYACVGSNHTTLDAIRLLQQRRPFGPDDVARIVVHGSQVTMDHVGWPYQPLGLTSAQLNLPFCVATLLLEGECFVDQFTEAIVADPRRMALAAKVSVQPDAAITARGARYRHQVRVDVHLTDGSRLEMGVESPRGSEHHFAPAEDVIAKFRTLARHAIPDAQAAALCDALLHVEALEDAANWFA